jgi:predicted PurR-regulated permease PerM
MEAKSKESVTPSPVPRKSATAARTQARALSDTAWWWIRSAAIVLTFYFGWLLVEQVWSWVTAVIEVAVLGLFGIVLALVVQPLVEWLEQRASMPRSAAILAVLGGLVAILVLGAVLIAGPLVGEADALSRQIPKLVHALQSQYDQLAPRLRAQGVPVNPQLVAGLGGGALGNQLAGLVLGGLAATVRLLVDTVIVLVVAFWILKDGIYFRRNVLRMLPVPVRAQVAFGFQATSAVVGGYVRAQVLIATTLGLTAGFGSWLLGVPDPLLVGLAAGVFELVPIVGPFAGGAVGVTLALTVSPLLALWTLLLFFGLHILEGYVLAPRVQARFTRIPEVVAFLSVFAGLEAGGFLGALFAVPAVSLLAIFLRAAIGDLKAEHPELFEARGPELTERRRRIVQEFRGTWWSRLRRRVNRRPVG